MNNVAGITLFVFYIITAIVMIEIILESYYFKARILLKITTILLTFSFNVQKMYKIVVSV